MGYGGVRRGVVGFGGFSGQKGRLKTKKMWQLFLWFGLVQFGLAGSAGFSAAEDARWPGGQEEKTPQVVQW